METTTETATEATTGVATKVEWPKISLVTPVWNSGKYIEQTIQSVLAQGYPNLEYFVVDGGSTDGTLEVIRKYEARIADWAHGGWVSEPDKGMYDALNKGFARTSGEVMGWISATDMLHTGALLAVGGIFRDLPEVEWVTGRPTWFNEDGMSTRVGELQRWSRWRFLAGANRYIQQESTFWRRSLWEKAGARVDASRRNGADFELWVRFFRHARLYTADTVIGGFRDHGASLGLSDLEACHRAHDEFIEAELRNAPSGGGSGPLRAFRGVNRAMMRVPKVRGVWQRLVMRPLYRVPGPDWAPVIGYNREKWFVKG